ncbi:hypothetical protein [Streptomyces sp. B1I3]|uniref:hypothetical protein n=1 Tax=Streptomyces sp. B1I3 TaxID=3042264 RepID=UPI0027875D72|nr:hypothetical protein [Streptomyces sp. B1I3]MDQ0797336.1 hypothetical protein [Streptomyces sp. B1I3]
MRKSDPLIQTATESSIPVGTSHAYTSKVIDLLADQAPGPLRVLREKDPGYVPLDGILAEWDASTVARTITPPSIAATM